ncbi:MAG: hypothetical protein ACREBO_08140 [Novosphingobium sp.]
MADRDPHSAEESHELSHQTGEEAGKIKRPQRTGERDLARGSETATREASQRRQ